MAGMTCGQCGANLRVVVNRLASRKWDPRLLALNMCSQECWEAFEVKEALATPKLVCSECGGTGLVMGDFSDGSFSDAKCGTCGGSGEQ